MLVLARRPTEAIIITTPTGEQIRVTVVSWDRGHRNIRIGIEAPDNIRIWREEIHGRAKGRTSDSEAKEERE